MRDLKDIIAANLISLRRAHGFTQSGLAEKLNYSDKAVSKWENAESLPGIEVLAELCKIYGVTLDYLTLEHGEPPAPKEDELRREKQRMVNHITIASLSVLSVWFIATAIFVNLLITLKLNYWMVFVWAVPVSCVVCIVFNAIWGKRRWMFILVSVLIWSLLLAIYLQLGIYTAWAMFIIGAPSQIAVVLWSKLRSTGPVRSACVPRERRVKKAAAESLAPTEQAAREESAPADKKE